MKKFLSILLVVISFSTIGIIVGFSPKSSSVKYQRIECYKFKENLCAKGIEKHFKEFEALTKSINYIKSYSAGNSISGSYENLANYDCVHTLVFDNEKDIENYYNHPSREQFVKLNQHVWQSVFVINSKVTE